MADRLSVFSDPEMIRLVSEDFVAVADNDWYSRRRQDAVGEFFRKVADQGPRKGVGGSTRQGIYAFTADGELLEFNNNRSLERRVQMLEKSLAKWRALPEGRRLPGKVSVPMLDAADLDAKYTRVPPKNGLILEVFTRCLTKEDGGFVAWQGAGGDEPGVQAARDHLWIRADEWQELIAAGEGAATKQSAADVPSRLAYRIMRFHLVDSTRGEPPMWSREDVKGYSLKICRGSDDRELLLFGNAQISAKDERGYDVSLSGIIRLEKEGDRPERFDLVAIGDHWGEGTYTRGARPGKTPLGVAMQLAAEGSVGRDVPPQASSWEQGYYEAEKH